MKALWIALPALLLAVSGSSWAGPGDELHAPGSLNQLKALNTFKNVPNVEALHSAASKGLVSFRSMVSPENFKAMGMEKQADAEKATLGTPSREYFVRLDALKNFKSGEDPEKLLVDSGMVHYPVVVDGNTRSAVTLSLDKGEWKVIALGQANRAQFFSRARAESVKRLKMTEGEHFIVRIPALNVEFEAVRDASNKLFLTPTLDYPDWGLKADVPEAAADVFVRLVPVAQKHDNLPH